MSHDFPIRKNIRLKNFDYSQQGAYFVTICTQGRACLFGEIVDGKMALNDFGRIVVAIWNDLPNHILGIELGEFVVMPNHIHAIIVIVGAGSKPARSGSKPARSVLEGPRKRAGFEPAPTGIKLSEIVRQLKTFSARQINKIRESSSRVWQRNYHEHIIRNEKYYERICEYILNNPFHWAVDKENPKKIARVSKKL